MGTDNEDNIRFSQLNRKIQHEVDHSLMALVSKNWKRSAPMGEIDNLSYLFGTTHVHFVVHAYAYTQGIVRRVI